MKLTKLISFLIDTTKAESLMLQVRKGQLVVSASDGVISASASVEAKEAVSGWPHKGVVTVTAADFKKAFRDDAVLSLDGSTLVMANGRWRVALPCDLIDRGVDTNIRRVAGGGMRPPSLLNVNTTDAFGADVWVSFANSPTPIVAVTSDYTATIFYGQDVIDSGSFPAKLLTAMKGIFDVVVKADNELVCVEGNYQIAAGIQVPVTVTSALPPGAPASLNQVGALDASVVGDTVTVSALELRDIVASVVKLMTKEVLNLRVRYSASKKDTKAAGSLSVAAQTEVATFTDAITAKTKTSGEMLLQTKMFTMAMAGIALTMNTEACITNCPSVDGAPAKIKVDIIESDKAGSKSKIATIIMVAGEVAE